MKNGEPIMRIVICTTCEPVGGVDGKGFAARVVEAIDDDGAPPGIVVDQVECMGACAEPMALALQAEGRASYLFSGLNPTTDVTDVLATCRVFLSSPRGWITDARPCGRLRDRLRARIPALPEARS